MSDVTYLFSALKRRCLVTLLYDMRFFWAISSVFNMTLNAETSNIFLSLKPIHSFIKPRKHLPRVLHGQLDMMKSNLRLIENMYALRGLWSFLLDVGSVLGRIVSWSPKVWKQRLLAEEFFCKLILGSQNSKNFIRESISPKRNEKFHIFSAETLPIMKRT